eukprot:2740702-Pleurochrysis_carterae.AAC.7
MRLNCKASERTLLERQLHDRIAARGCESHASSARTDGKLVLCGSKALHGCYVASNRVSGLQSALAETDMREIVHLHSGAMYLKLSSPTFRLRRSCKVARNLAPIAK